MSPEYILDENGNPIGSKIPQVQPNASYSQLLQALRPMGQSNLPSPIQMAPILPGQQAEMNLGKPPVYGDAQFAQGKLRTVLNAIAGGLAGAAGRPEIGRELRDQPYTRAVQRYQSQLAPIKAQEAIEQERVTRSEKEQQLGIQKLQAQNLYTHRELQDEIAKEKLAEAQRVNTANIEYKKGMSTDRIQRLDLLRRKLPIEQLKDYDQLSPQMQEQFANMYEAMHPLKPDTFEKYQAMTPEEQKQFQDFKTKQAQAVAQGQFNVTGSPKAIEVTGQKAGAVSKERTKARWEVEEEKVSKETDALAMQAINDPDSYWNYFNKVPRAGRDRFIDKTNQIIGMGKATKPINQQQQKTVDTAKTTVLHVNRLNELIDDPELQARVGPLQGRLSELNQTIGTEAFHRMTEEEKFARIQSVGTSGSISAKEAEFLSLMKYLVLFEASSTTGSSRPSWELVKYLGQTQGAKFDVEKIRANLKAAKEAAVYRIQGIYGPSSKGMPIEQPNQIQGIKIRVIE